jgi:hypothetical protein
MGHTAAGEDADGKGPGIAAAGAPDVVARPISHDWKATPWDAAIGANIGWEFCGIDIIIFGCGGKGNPE